MSRTDEARRAKHVYDEAGTIAKLRNKRNQNLIRDRSAQPWFPTSLMKRLRLRDTWLDDFGLGEVIKHASEFVVYDVKGKSPFYLFTNPVPGVVLLIAQRRFEFGKTQIGADLAREDPSASMQQWYKHQRGSVLNSGWMHKDAVGQDFNVRMYRTCRRTKLKKQRSEPPCLWILQLRERQPTPKSKRRRGRGRRGIASKKRLRAPFNSRPSGASVSTTTCAHVSSSALKSSQNQSPPQRLGGQPPVDVPPHSARRSGRRKKTSAKYTAFLAHNQHGQASSPSPSPRERPRKRRRVNSDTSMVPSQPASVQPLRNPVASKSGCEPQTTTLSKPRQRKRKPPGGMRARRVTFDTTDVCEAGKQSLTTSTTPKSATTTFNPHGDVNVAMEVLEPPPNGRVDRGVDVFSPWLQDPLSPVRLESLAYDAGACELAGCEMCLVSQHDALVASHSGIGRNCLDQCAATLRYQGVVPSLTPAPPQRSMSPSSSTNLAATPRPTPTRTFPPRLRLNTSTSGTGGPIPLGALTPPVHRGSSSGRSLPRSEPSTPCSIAPAVGLGHGVDDGTPAGVVEMAASDTSRWLFSPARAHRRRSGDNTVVAPSPLHLFGVDVASLHHCGGNGALQLPLPPDGYGDGGVATTTTDQVLASPCTTRDNYRYAREGLSSQTGAGGGGLMTHTLNLGAQMDGTCGLKLRNALSCWLGGNRSQQEATTTSTLG